MTFVCQKKIEINLINMTSYVGSYEDRFFKSVPRYEQMITIKQKNFISLLENIVYIAVVFEFSVIWSFVRKVTYDLNHYYADKFLM